MEHLVLITFTLSFFIFIRYLLGLYAKTKLPPGPIGLPLFGNLLQIGPKPHKSLAKLAKEYGPLITIQLGCYTSLVVSSPEMAREILQKHDADFSGRSIPDAVARGLPNHYVSVTWTSAGDQWRAIRRALTIYFTNPKKIDELEGLRLKVVTQMADHIKELSKRGQVVDIGKVTFTTALNQMSNTCFSVDVADFDSDQDHVNGFHKAVKTIMKVVGKINFADYFPWLKIFDPQGIRRDAKAAYDSLGQLCQMFIAQRLRHRESKFPPHGDLLDSFLDCHQENPVDFDIIHIKVLLMDLFIAGTDNISGIVEWAMSELVLHPNFDWMLPNNMLPEELDMDDTSGIAAQKATPLLLIPTTTNTWQP
ncbi:geraniol 8-hydroxylase-like [Heracleum sosnowskyi]|uniref:Geraniol 8-hydroxylase-like n=1 Tax=Heracleum sosnowskyi TaxID=360622 RepID=A0AAD8HSU9_9APIA|nr:geraniol 8-hydroxylase-like [Heracleum sosnowskyi]